LREKADISGSLIEMHTEAVLCRVPSGWRRVMLLSTNLSLGGGAEWQTIQLAIRLKLRGWEVRMVSLLPPHGDLFPLREAGIPVQSLQMLPGIPDPRAMLRLGRILRSWKPRILHSHMEHANLLARATRLLYPVPVLICTLHSLRMYAVKTDTPWLKEAAHRVTNFLAEATTAVCNVAGERYVRVKAVSRDRMRVIPNGVDTARFRPNRETRETVRRALRLENSFTWLAVGRCEMAKDHGTMLRAFAQVSRDSPDTILLIVGGGSLRREMEQLSETLGIATRVRFLGQRADVADLLNGVDGYVMSSLFEGLPLALLEAAASGLPIVATDVGGNAEIVTEGSTGFLAPPRAPEALAIAMRRLMSMSEEARMRMGANGRAFCISHFQFDKIVDLWETLYGELLQRKGQH
jgi:glycosyltransferase involved in cell wall biosynthesis